MKKIKRILEGLIVGAFFCVATAFVVLLLVGAFNCANSIVLGESPTMLEWFGAIFTMLMGGAFGVTWFIFDTDGGDEE